MIEICVKFTQKINAYPQYYPLINDGAIYGRFLIPLRFIRNDGCFRLVKG